MSEKQNSLPKSQQNGTSWATRAAPIPRQKFAMLAIGSEVWKSLNILSRHVTGCHGISNGSKTSWVTWHYDAICKHLLLEGLDVHDVPCSMIQWCETCQKTLYLSTRLSTLPHQNTANHTMTALASMAKTSPRLVKKLASVGSKPRKGST